MAISFITSSNAQINALGISITFASPASVGDYAIVALSSGIASNSWTPPAGWTQIGTNNSTTSQTLAVYAKILATADIGTARVFTAAITGKQALQAVVYRGVDSTTPLGSFSAGSSNTTSSTRTSPTLACSNRCIEIMSSKGTDPGAWTVPGTFTDRGQIAQTSTGAVTLGIADSTTDLDGTDVWSSAVALTQYQAMTLWVASASASAPPSITNTQQNTVRVSASGVAGANGTITYSISQTSGATSTPVLISPGIWSIVRNATQTLSYTITGTESPSGLTATTVVNVAPGTGGTADEIRVRSISNTWI